MISLNEVTVNYGAESALNNITLNVRRGSALALIGPSGCGKTTLLNVIAGLQKTTSGSVSIETTNKHPKDSVGMIMQSTSLFPWLTIHENVSLGLLSKKMSTTEINTAVHQVLKNVDILIHKDKYPSQLSGGQAQRAAIARTWILQPDILLLDEPTSSLDAITKESIQEMLRNHQCMNEKTTIVVTHSIEEAVFLGQSIVLLYNGKVAGHFENASYGMQNARNQIAFYNKVIEIRKAFKEVHN